MLFLKNNAEKMCKLLKGVSTEPKCSTGLFPCTLCGGPVNSFHILPSANLDNIRGNLNLGELELAAIDKVKDFVHKVYQRIRVSVLLLVPSILIIVKLEPRPEDLVWFV